MLILTRRIGESILIGENMDISVTVLRNDNGQFRIGINAPRDVPVHREEIANRIIRERSIVEDNSIISEPKIY